MFTPCKECERRHPHCHGHCEDYKTFLIDNENRKKSKLAECDVDSYISIRAWRIKKGLRHEKK